MTQDIEQGSDEWFAARCGKATASKIADVIAKTKSGYSTSRANYAAQLIIERLTGQKVEGFSNAAMQWGIETEAQARAAYDLHSGNDVKEIGFVIHPSIPESGASPDGTIGDDGLLEIKCPNTATHIDFLLSPEVDKKYHTQMQWQMACTGRKWCDFASFDPRLPLNLQLKVVRISRNEATIAELEQEVRSFLDEVDQKVIQLKSLGA